ncbi:D-alanyl-D-alanine carboxypeptidase family protein [Streptomyces phytohabitans]|uniref:D-alanyl-D-alanine carboxypeptidase family protein n=1 Tax=Streptomyces phytohabitans TaxID=1150371 RepID=UPI00345B5C79
MRCPPRTPVVPPPAPAPVRARPPRAVVGVVAAVLLALWSVPGLADPGDGDELSPGARPLPWPREGQASVAVEGVGSLGTRGRQEPVPIASVTKVMTAYVILRDHPLRAGKSGPSVTVDRRAAAESASADESSVRLREGRRLSQRRLLELMLIPSGNNAARLLARWDAGSEEAFTARMNDAAAALGMDRTTYTGASGYEPTTRSTSDDQLVLAAKVMRNRTFREIVAQPGTTEPGTGARLANTNTLLGHAGIVGGKTGSSTPAGGALMWVATTGGGAAERLVLGVVLHQRPGSGPAPGLEVALARSRALAEGARAWAAK